MREKIVGNSNRKKMVFPRLIALLNENSAIKIFWSQITPSRKVLSQHSDKIFQRKMLALIVSMTVIKDTGSSL